jgi:NhaP-type Na+/H+ or K+/H+ antiporter
LYGRSWVRFALEQVGLGVLVGVGIELAGGWLAAWASRKGWIVGSFQRLALLALALIAWALADQIGGNASSPPSLVAWRSERL